MANSPNAPASFEPPHPGSKAMPRWESADLVDAPKFTWRNWIGLIGPGLVAGGSAIGGGEWLTGPAVTARYGGALLWLATISILVQVIYNLEISRYTLYTGESIFTGKFRLLPGPMFWLFVYLLLDFGSVFPYLAANAATPLATLWLGEVPDMTNDDHANLHRGMQYAAFLLFLTPLVVGGKVYNSMKVLMSTKIVIVLGFLTFLALAYSHAPTWKSILGGFVQFGNVPIRAAEDRNGNGVLDPGEDWDGDGKLDGIEKQYEPTIDTNNDGKPDQFADTNGDGKPDKFKDVDGDGIRDGDNVDNFFAALWEGRSMPLIDLSMIAILSGMVAIAGSGGLTNTSISAYTRDQGWGMGWHVGAIPSVIGGHHIQLSHVGKVFPVNADTLPVWKRWLRHVRRDQLVVWMPACFVGLALPSMLSVEFLRRGTEVDDTTVAAMTAGQVSEKIAEVSGWPWWGNVCWFMVLFCGVLVLAPTITSTADGFIRRWVDVFWTGSSRMRKVDPHKIRFIYFGMLTAYAVFGLIMLSFAKPLVLVKIVGMIYNFALGFSCWHALAVNLVLLPRPLRPGWFSRVGLLLGGVFFTTLASLAAPSVLRELGYL